MGNNYLDKVVDQIVRETNHREGEKYMDIPWIKHKLTKTLFDQRLRYDKSFRGKLNIPQPFTKHCKNIYGLNKEETGYVWNEYVQTIKDMIERNKNTITESEEITVKDSIFLRKMIKYLKDNTKVVIEPFDIYDGYIIAPIGNGFRWDFYHKTLQPHEDFANEWWKEMQGVYGLSSKEVLIVMDVYINFIWETLEKISDGR